MRFTIIPYVQKQNEVKTTQPVASPKQLLLLAIPTLGQLIAEPTFVLIDTAIVGHVGDAALAGLSLGSTIILTAVGLCIFLAYSTTSQVAHFFGAGKRKDGLQAGIDGLWLALLIGTALALCLFVVARPLCILLGGQGEVLEQAVLYTRAIVLGAPGMLLVYAATGIFRGLQRIRITLIAAVGGAVINTILDVLFVIVFGWGIAGSGIATLIAQWSMGLWLAIPACLWARHDGVSLRPRIEGIKAASSDGWPLFIRTLALRVAMVATVMVAARLGTQVLAAYQAVNAAWNFALNILDSVAIAGQTLVGAALGAKAFDQARKLTRTTAITGTLLGVVVGAIFAFLGACFAFAFTPNAEIQILITAGMATVGIFFPMLGWMWALDGILIGAGDFRYLALTCSGVSAVYLVVLVACIAFVFPHIQHPTVLTIALWGVFNIVQMGGRTITNALRARTDCWMHREIAV